MTHPATHEHTWPDDFGPSDEADMLTATLRIDAERLERDHALFTRDQARNLRDTMTAIAAMLERAEQ